MQAEIRLSRCNLGALAFWAVARFTAEYSPVAAISLSGFSRLRNKVLNYGLELRISSVSTESDVRVSARTFNEVDQPGLPRPTWQHHRLH